MLKKIVNSVACLLVSICSIAVHGWIRWPTMAASSFVANAHVKLLSDIVVFDDVDDQKQWMRDFGAARFGRITIDGPYSFLKRREKEEQRDSRRSLSSILSAPLLLCVSIREPAKRFASECV